jgi:Family of unknown function (DUF5675)
VGEGAVSEHFHIVIKRESAKGNLVPGLIYVNGKALGRTYENDELKIPARDYVGLLRYHSGHHFVQGPHGAMGTKGDFLVEVSGVDKRTNILFHTGNQPKHSKGCILLGPINSSKSKSGGVEYSVTEESPLRRLRLLFYGTDEPVSSPDKAVKISVIDP